MCGFFKAGNSDDFDGFWAGLKFVNLKNGRHGKSCLQSSLFFAKFEIIEKESPLTEDVTEKYRISCFYREC